MKEYLREKKEKQFGFFILLDLIIFSEVIKILQKSIDHTQFKTTQAWRVIYRLNP